MKVQNGEASLKKENITQKTNVDVITDVKMRENLISFNFICITPINKCLCTIRTEQISFPKFCFETLFMSS